jgi:hypothetical protein
MIAGIFCAIAFLAGWTAIFAPHLETGRSKLLRTLIVTIVLGTAVVAGQFAELILTGPIILTAAILFLAITVGCVEILALFSRTRRTFVPICSGLFALFTVPATCKLAEVAREMWSSTVDPGGLGRFESIPLAGVHFLLICMSLVLTAILWFRVYRKVRQAIRVPAIAATLFVVFSSIAFFWTVPRSGDEGTILWLLLVPGFLLGSVLLLATALFVLTLSRRRHSLQGTGFVKLM